MDGTKTLILLSVVAAAAILGSMAVLGNASDNGEKSRCPRNLTDEQRDD